MLLGVVLQSHVSHTHTTHTHSSTHTPAHTPAVSTTHTPALPTTHKCVCHTYTHTHTCAHTHTPSQTKPPTDLAEACYVTEHMCVHACDMCVCSCGYPKYTYPILPDIPRIRVTHILRVPLYPIHIPETRMRVTDIPDTHTRERSWTG